MAKPLTAAQDVAAEKALCYGIFEAFNTVVAYPDSGPDDVAEANQAKADYLRLEIPGNNNSYVPWVSSDTEFQCPTCNMIITADQEHALHREDKELLQRYPAVNATS